MRVAAFLLALCALVGCMGDDDPAPRPAAPAQALWPQPRAYTLDLAYDERAMALSGTQRIAFENTSGRALERVWLRLWANAAGGCARPSIRVEVARGGRAGERRRDCTALEVRLDAPLPAGGQAALDLRLRVAVPQRADRFGRFRGAAYFGNALPLLAVGDASGPRLPAYSRRGEAFFSLAAAWSARLRLPAGVIAITTGVRRGERYSTARARDFTIVAGRLQERSTVVGGVRVRHFSQPGRAAGEARRALASARGSLERFSRWFGPYGAAELDLVDSPAQIGQGGVAMEYPELVLTPSFPAAVAHEVAHQWWWGILGNDQAAEPWLDEALASWSAWRLPAAVGGGRSARCGRPRDRVPELTAPMAQFERARAGAYSDIVYRGGACALTRIARAVGPERLDAALRALVAARRHGTWTRADFLDVVRAAAPPGVDADALLRRERLLD